MLFNYLKGIFYILKVNYLKIFRTNFWYILKYPVLKRSEINRLKD